MAATGIAEVVDALTVAHLTVGAAEAFVLRVPGVSDDGVFGDPSGADPSLPDVLDDAERERMSRYVRAVDRARYEVAHTALRLVLGARLDLPARALRFERSACPGCGEPHGRPVLAGLPPRGRVEFSLSHGGALVAVAVAPHAVGVDVEPDVPSPTSAGLVPRLHPGERRLVDAAAPADRPAAFTRVWVRKEAYLKGLGIGLGRPLDADDVTVPPPGWDLVDTTIRDHRVALAVLSENRPE